MDSAKRASVRPGPGADHVTVGTVIAGKYRLDARLGSGGMGTVWSCTHLALGDRMAIKIVSTSIALSQEVRSRFVREARAAARLKSRFSVQVFDSGELPHGTPYIVMEYLDGETLRQHLRRVSRLPLPETVGILTQVARGLERAHEAGIVHRDIKPDNIFLAQTPDDGVVAKVFDFGVAKLVDATNATETVAGSFVGTPQFMSPEQAMGQPDVDHRTDIYSLGVLAYRMLTGRALYEVGSIPALLLQICNGPLPKLRDLLPDLPPEVDVWFQRTCARERDLRFGSASECVEALLLAAGMSASKLSLADSSSSSGLHSGTHRAREQPYFTPAPPGSVPPPSALEHGSTTGSRAGLSWRSVALVVGILATVVSPLLLRWSREPRADVVRGPAAQPEESTSADVAPSPPAAMNVVRSGVSLDGAPSASAPASSRTVVSHPAYPAAQTSRAASQPPAPKHPDPVPAMTSQGTTSVNNAITDVGY
jgi:serine/threonine protein kinase